MEGDKKRKLSAKTARELYPYPYRSKGENLTRCGVWIASWIFGILIPSLIGQTALGGSYLIFAASMMLEFIPESRSRPWAIAAHGFFCLLLFAMLIGSFVLISFPSAPVQTDKAYGMYIFTMQALQIAGVILFVMIFVGVVLVLFEVHKRFYNEEEEGQHTAEEQRETERRRFNEKLVGEQGREGAQ